MLFPIGHSLLLPWIETSLSLKPKLNYFQFKVIELYEPIIFHEIASNCTYSQKVVISNIYLESDKPNFFTTWILWQGHEESAFVIKAVVSS